MRPLGRIAVSGGGLTLLPGVVAAHGTAVHESGALWSHWDAGLGTVIPLALGAWFYIQGLLRLWHRAGIGAGISRKSAAAYAAGMAILAVALASPLEAVATGLFSAHMVQHLLLILVVPPLLIVGAPDVALLWLLPRRRRAGAARAVNRFGRMLGSGGRGPLLVVLLATGTLWAWHLPQLYDLAVRNELVHWAEHAGFLVTALLFWATVLRLRPRDHFDNGMRILCVCAMVLQGSLLGALITFSSHPLYQSHAETLSRWGIEPLVDQQIAGLIMWIPPAVLYFGVIAWLFVRWLAAVGARRDACDRAVRDSRAQRSPGAGVDEIAARALAPAVNAGASARIRNESRHFRSGDES